MVALSLDSDLPTVSYSSLPYNRITIFQSPSSGIGHFSESMLISKFYEAVSEAVASSIRSPFSQFASDFMRMDSLQPVALLNIPSAFLDGVIDNYIYSQTRVIFDDEKSLVILSQAKKEGIFPSWHDCVGGRDISPTELSTVANSGFAAYIQQRWGMEKFIDFWQECGKVDFFRLTNRKFLKIYGISIKQAWKDFEESIPVSNSSSFGENVFNNDVESRYSNIIGANGKIYYYNSMKHDICYFTEKHTKNRIKIATGITNLAISDDENYLALSYQTKKSSRELQLSLVQVYNLKKKIFIPEKLNLQHANFVNLTVDKIGIAGFYAKNTSVFLKVYEIENSSKYKNVYSLKLPDGCIMQGIVNAGVGKILCIYYYKNECILQTVDIFKDFSTYEKFPVTASNFKNCKIQNEIPAVCFTYTQNKSYEHEKLGFFEITPEKTIYLSQNDFSGGINDAYIYFDKIYFSCHNARHDEMRWGLLKNLNFVQAKTQTLEPIQSEFSVKNFPDTITSGNLGEFEIKKYNPFKYSLKGTWFPFFPIIKIDFEDFYEQPGLGATFLTRSDPLGLITSAFSFCKGYIDTTEKKPVIYDDFVASANLATMILPVNFDLHGIFYFNEDGEYNLQMIFGSVYYLPVGMEHNKLSFSLKEKWECSTKIFDYKNEKIVNLNNWPSIQSSYNTFNTYFNVSYSNYHQSGFSIFEQRGYEIGFSILGIYDPQKSQKDEENSSFQFTTNFSLGVKLPFLIPVFGVDKWIVCLPTSFFGKLYGEEGTSFEGNSETLILGYEFQKGIPGLSIFIQRLGVKLGYNFKSTYNRLTSDNTDIRYIEKFANVFNNSTVNDYLYINIEATTSPSLGKFSSSTKINAGIQFQMDIRNKKGYAVALFEMNM